MKILLATDAWHPQINGVVRTYEHVIEQLKSTGHQVLLITPQDFVTVPCPTYPSIKLAIFPGHGIAKRIKEFTPDAIHIATEGPIGIAARTFCLKHNLPFTTSFHTQFPEYIRMRAPVPIEWTYAWFRNFHNKASRTMVATQSQKKRLEDHGIKNLVMWSRGVNTKLFYPRLHLRENLEEPVFVYVGRVAVEKNIEAFLDLDLPGKKRVVGDGPDLNKLIKKYPNVEFTGFKTGVDLAEQIASGSVFIFPSLTDTYGIVMLEAMACGLPVAAFPVTGPIDVVLQGETGILDNDLQKAALMALEISPEACVNFARENSWQRCAELFLENLEPVTGTSIVFPEKEEYAETT